MTTQTRVKTRPDHGGSRIDLAWQIPLILVAGLGALRRHHDLSPARAAVNSQRRSHAARRGDRALLRRNSFGRIRVVPGLTWRGKWPDEPLARGTHGCIELRGPARAIPFGIDRRSPGTSDDLLALVHLEVDRAHLAMRRKPRGRDRRRRLGNMRCEKRLQCLASRAPAAQRETPATRRPRSPQQAGLRPQRLPIRSCSSVRAGCRGCAPAG